MAYLHGLIALLLAAFFASPVLAQTPETCQEHRVRDIAGPPTTKGTGWQLTLRDAFVGSTYTQQDSCYRSVTSVVGWSATKGCSATVVQTKINSECPGLGSYSHPASWGTCSGMGFSTETRSTLNEPQDVSLPVGYFVPDGSPGAEADLDKYLTARFALIGQKICMEGKRHILGEPSSPNVHSTQDCYTINGVERCMTYSAYSATPTCEVCQAGDPTKDTKPAAPDTDGDGDPDNTDPDADGDGNPDNGGGDPGGGDPGGGDPGGGDPGGGDPGGGDPGDTGGGTGPDSDGDGNPDTSDPDDDNDGCLDVDEPCAGPDSDGDGNPDATDPDDDNDGCLDVNEPCSGTNPDGGDDGGDGDGQCDPQTQDCSDTPGSFGGNCMAGFNCSGDAIQCAIAREMHRRNCKMFEDKSPESELYNQNKGKEGDQTGDLPGNQTFNFMGYIKQINLLGGGAGFNDLTVDVYGKSITIPFTRINPFLVIFGNILVAVSLLAAVRIVGRA